MEEELVIDFNKKPCPGLNIFNGSDCFKYFSKETVLVKYIESITKEQFKDYLVFSAVHHLVCDQKMLFYLMSVCPDEEVVDVCRDCWRPSETFTLSVHDVVHVFLNWGATPKSLGIDGDQKLSSCFVPTLNPVSVPDFPAPYNVKAVLYAVADCLSNEQSVDADKHRYDLVKVLVRASLDHRLGRHRFDFHQVVYQILDNFPDWNSNKEAVLIEHLSLQRMGTQNAAYICCSWFASSPRIQDFKVSAIRHLLHSRFELASPVQPLKAVVESLPDTNDILLRFRMVEIYVLIQLLNTLLTADIWRPQSEDKRRETEASVELIEKIRYWSEAVHFELMNASNYLYTLEGGVVREKCSRMCADCVELARILKS